MVLRLGPSREQPRRPRTARPHSKTKACAKNPHRLTGDVGLSRGASVFQSRGRDHDFGVSYASNCWSRHCAGVEHFVRKIIHSEKALFTIHNCVPKATTARPHPRYLTLEQIPPCVITRRRQASLLNHLCSCSNMIRQSADRCSTNSERNARGPENNYKINKNFALTIKLCAPELFSSFPG